MFADEGVYVNTNGELVRHAMLQWGETPYAIGKLSCKLMIRANIFRILLSRIIDKSSCRFCFPNVDHVTIPERVFSLEVGRFHAGLQSF